MDIKKLEELKNEDGLLDFYKVWDNILENGYAKEDDLDYKKLVDLVIKGYNAPELTRNVYNAPELSTENKQVENYSIVYPNKYIYQPVVTESRSYSTDFLKKNMITTGEITIGIQVLEPLVGDYTSDEIKTGKGFRFVKMISIEEYCSMLEKQLLGLKAAKEIEQMDLIKNLQKKSRDRLSSDIIKSGITWN